MALSRIKGTTSGFTTSPAPSFGSLVAGDRFAQFDPGGAPRGGDSTTTAAPNAGFARPTSSLMRSGPSAVGSGGGSSRPFQIGTKTTEFGRPEFNAALIDWNAVFNEAQKGSDAAFALIDQFAPGGGFGAGLRQEATEQVQGGVARDTASAVASGSSSISSARGINTLAGSELSKRFANIEDTRAGLQLQSLSPFSQMLSNLTSLISVRPNAARDIERITTPEFSGSRKGRTNRLF